MMGGHYRILGGCLLVIISGFGLALLWRVPARTDQVLATSASPIELAIFPDKLWRAGTTNTQLVVGLKGKGYTGPVTVDITGLPKASGEGIDGFVQCDSNCAPAGVGLGRPPYAVPVVDGQWKMFAPYVYPPLDSTTDYTDQTYILTVTATIAGYSPVSKTTTFFVEHPYDQPSANQGTPQVYHQPGVPACAAINDGASQPIRPANKLSVAAGGSVTFTCSWRAPEKSNYLQNQWVDGTSLTFVSTHDSANPLYEPTITGTFSRSSAPFNKPSPPQCGGNPYSCTFDTSKDVVVEYTVQTSTATPAGVYVFAFGSKNASGYYRVAPEGVLTVTESVSSPTSTPSPSPSATSAEPAPSVSSQGSAPPSSPVTTSTSQSSSSTNPSLLPSLGPVVSPTPSLVTTAPTSSSSPPLATQYHQSMIASGVVTDAEGIALPFAQVTFGGASSTTDQYGYYVVSTYRSNERAEAQRLAETLKVSAPLFPRPETTVTTELPYDLTQRDTAYTKDIQLPPSTGPQLHFEPNPATAGGQIAVTATGFPSNQTLYLFMNPYVVETKRESDGTRYLRQTGIFANASGVTFPTPQTDVNGTATFSITAPRALNKKLTMIATTTLESVIPASQDEQRFASLTATTGIGGVLPGSVGAMKILQTNYALRPGETKIKAATQQLIDLGLSQLPATAMSSLTAAVLAPDSIGQKVRTETVSSQANATLVANPSVTLSFGNTSAITCQLADATPALMPVIRRAVAQSRTDLCSGNRQQTFNFVTSSDPRKYGNSLTILQGMSFWLSQLQTILSQPTLTPEQRNQLTSDLSLMNAALRLIETNYQTQETQVIIPQLQSRVRQVATQFQNHPASQRPLPTQATYQPQVRLEWRFVPGVVISTQYTGPNKFANETITTIVDRQKYRSNLSPAVVSPYLDTFLFNPGTGSVIVTIQLSDGQIITSPPLKNQSDWTQFIQNQKLFGPDGKAILHGFIDEDGQFKTLAEAEAQWRRVVKIVEGGAFELHTRLQRLTNYNPLAFLGDREVILKTKSEGLNLVGVKLGAAYVILRSSSQTSDFYSCPKSGLSTHYPMIGYYLMNDLVTGRIPTDRVASPVFCGESLAQAQDKAATWLNGQKNDDHYLLAPEAIGVIEQYEQGVYLKELAALQAELAAVEGELLAASRTRGYEVLGNTRRVQHSSEFLQTAQRGTPWFPPVLAADEADEIIDPVAGDESALLQTQETNYLRVAFQGVPALLTVTDPLGRSVGTHPLTNLPLAQIPDAVVGGSGTPHSTVFLPQVIKGKYTVMVTPLADGDGTLWTESSIGGSEPEQTVIAKNVQVGKPEIGTITIDFDTQSAVPLGLRLRNHVLFSYHKAPIIWWGSGLVLLSLVFISIRKIFADQQRRPTQS